MNTATINFSDGTKLIVKENDLLIPVVKYPNESKNEESPFETFTSEGKPYEIWYHASFQLTPSILEFLLNCEYFRKLDSTVFYNSKNVVSVENN